MVWLAVLVPMVTQQPQNRWVPIGLAIHAVLSQKKERSYSVAIEAGPCELKKCCWGWCFGPPRKQNFVFGSAWLPVPVGRLLPAFYNCPVDLHMYWCLQRLPRKDGLRLLNHSFCLLDEQLIPATSIHKKTILINQENSMNRSQEPSLIDVRVLLRA